MSQASRIRLARPLIDQSEEHAVLEVLRSGMLVQGPVVARFEDALASATARSHAVAVANGTAALRLALVALGVEPGDDVLCPNLTWPSPAHAILELGATPVLVDVDPATWNVTAAAMAQARTAQTKAAIVIDQFGNPAPTPDIAQAISGLPIVVDAACSLGSRYQDAPCGSFGDIACMSFHPRKVLTTGEGGVCLTSSIELAERLRVLRNHGQSKPGKFAEASGNYRLSEIAAALGLAQLQRLTTIVSARQRLAVRYRAELPKTLTLQQSVPSAASNAQTMGALLPATSSANDRDRLVTTLAEEGVEAGRLSYALHELPHLLRAKRQGDYESSAMIAACGFALPLYPSMTEIDQSRVIDAMHNVVRRLF